MGPVEVVQLVLRLIRIDAFQVLVSAAATALLTWGFIYNLAEDTSYNFIPDSWDGGCFWFTAVSSSITMRVARRGADKDAEERGRRSYSLLAGLLLAAWILSMFAVLLVAVIMTALKPAYLGSAQFALACEAVLSAALGLAIWLADPFVSRQRDRNR